MDIEKIVWLDTDSLETYPNNAKIHNAEQVERIKLSIQEFGFNDPIQVSKDNVVIAGHGRLLAAKELGMEKVPCIVLDHLNEQQQKAYRNVHNKLNMDTGFDWDLLSLDLAEITEIDMADFGFHTEAMNVDIDSFFELEEGEKTPKQKLITCPHCGQVINLNDVK